jgi:hypothetical protein
VFPLLHLSRNGASGKAGAVQRLSSGNVVVRSPRRIYWPRTGTVYVWNDARNGICYSAHIGLDWHPLTRCK